ncbi:hypothetical protein O6H91_01G053200 [Diphasiastrum complanatum]|uniref:Uncharacterized protein n=1 Tax=Diphasiastrum complanatum TaxID=34168 RepID=A0ACC2ER40_DIPCM|nr:hypothetical protein O6H91_01G053200 [Diphasiastrum complanatum]
MAEKREEAQAQREEVEVASAISTVRFPRSQPQQPVLKVAIDSADDNSPNNFWQMYLLGGFMIARWAWLRWKERASRRRPSMSGED